MRVLLLSPYSSSTASGVATWVREFSDVLASRGHEVVVEEGGVFAPPGLRNLALALRGARAVWRFGHVDVVHCQQFHLQSLLAGLLARTMGKGVVLTVHGRSPRPSGLRGTAFDFVDWACRAVPHGIVFVAESLRGSSTIGSVVPTGVRIARDRAAMSGREEARLELGLGRSFTLLFLGRVTEDKGVVLLLQALRSIKTEGGTVPRLLLVGPIADGVRQRIAASLRELGEQVIVVGQRSDPGRYLAAADALVLPSLHEGLPLSVLEAMAARLPVIASDVGDLSKVVRQGETGWLVAPGRVDALAAAIREAAGSPEREEMGRRAAVLVAESYDLGRIVVQYEEIYKAIARPAVAGL